MRPATVSALWITTLLALGGCTIEEDVGAVRAAATTDATVDASIDGDAGDAGDGDAMLVTDAVIFPTPSGCTKKRAIRYRPRNGEPLPPEISACAGNNSSQVVWAGCGYFDKYGNTSITRRDGKKCGAGAECLPHPQVLECGYGTNCGDMIEYTLYENTCARVLCRDLPTAGKACEGLTCGTTVWTGNNVQSIFVARGETFRACTTGGAQRQCQIVGANTSDCENRPSPQTLPSGLTAPTIRDGKPVCDCPGTTTPATTTTPTSTTCSDQCALGNECVPGTSGFDTLGFWECVEVDATCSTCPSTTVSGDLICSAGESATSPDCTFVCGDDFCQRSESQTNTCAADCAFSYAATSI